jgi:peptidoglycan/LPS O-acetylase OafA/YrhL
MGLAILWIFLYHSKIFFPDSFLFHPFRLIISSGYGGVDVFFFLSGFGLMHHMLAYESTSCTFYRKRLVSIFPSYLPATIIVLFIDYVIHQAISVKKIFLSLTTIGFWIEDSTFYWFIPSILFLYFIYPIFYKYYLKYRIRLIYSIILLSIGLCIALTSTKHQHIICFFRESRYSS